MRNTFINYLLIFINTEDIKKGINCTRCNEQLSNGFLLSDPDVHSSYHAV